MTDRLTGVSARLVSERKLFICNQINTLPASKSYQGQIIQRHEQTETPGLRGQTLSLASVIFFIDQRFVVRRAPLPVAGNLQRPTLISHPANPVAFPIEGKVSFISCNLLCSLRLSIDSTVYLWTERTEKGSRNKQTNKTEHRSHRRCQLAAAVIDDKVSLNVLKCASGQMHQSRAETQINTIFLFVFPSLCLLSQ